MSIYFHAKSCGFFMDEFNGPRTFLINDPDWTRPTVLVTDPNWEPSEDDMDAEVPRIELPDPDARPPLIEVPNPNCSLPPVEELREITPELHLELLGARSRGLLLLGDADGLPETSAPPPPSVDELVNRERVWRDRELNSTDSMVVRHRDELEAQRPTTLTTGQYTEVQAYRLELRDWPELPAFPAKEHRPVAPAWLKGLLGA